MSDCACVFGPWTDSRLWNSFCGILCPPQTPSPFQTSPLLSLYTREAGRQTLQSCAWAGCFGAGWCLSLSLSCVRVSQSVISITNFIRSEKQKFLTNDEPERRSGAFQHIFTKRNGNAFPSHEPERRSAAFRSISSTDLSHLMPKPLLLSKTKRVTGAK